MRDSLRPAGKTAVPPQEEGFNSFDRFVLIRQTITVAILAGNPAQRLRRPALGQQRHLPPQHRRREPDKKLIPAGQQIEDGRTVRQRIGKAGHIGQKLAGGARPVGFPGQNPVRIVWTDQWSVEHDTT